MTAWWRFANGEHYEPASLINRPATSSGRFRNGEWPVSHSSTSAPTWLAISRCRSGGSALSTVHTTYVDGRLVQACRASASGSVGDVGRRRTNAQATVAGSQSL